MGTMRYKPSDKVRIKSLDWYNENKNKFGKVWTSGGQIPFDKYMSKWCDKVMTISDVRADHYTMIEDLRGYWTDEMIEGLVEEETKPLTYEETVEIIEAMQGIGDSWECPEGYIFKDENGNVINATKIVLEKKKKEYPKTYKECAKILDCFSAAHIDGYKNALLEKLQELLVCRDAYWKIAGEEMGLGKPWEPDWTNADDKFIIQTYNNKVGYWSVVSTQRILAFPTPEMRDAFKENFDPDIEFCKEFL